MASIYAWSSAEVTPCPSLPLRAVAGRAAGRAAGELVRLLVGLGRRGAQCPRGSGANRSRRWRAARHDELEAAGGLAVDQDRALVAAVRQTGRIQPGGPAAGARLPGKGAGAAGCGAV